MGFSRQEYWSRLPPPSPGYLPYPEVELTSPALKVDYLLTEPLGSPCNWINLLCFLGIGITHVSSHSISLPPWKPWFWFQYTLKWASQLTPVVKNLPTNTGDITDVSSIPGSGRSPGGGHGNPLQCSCLEHPMEWRAWRATVNRVTKSCTQLKKVSLQTLK